MSDLPPGNAHERRYTSGELARRLLGLAWQFSADCLRSLAPKRR